MKKCAMSALIVLSCFNAFIYTEIVDYIPSWCTINRTLLQGAKALHDQVIYMGAMAGNPEAIRLLKEYYEQKSPIELMCEMGATSLSEFGNRAVKAIIDTNPALSSATETALYSIMYKLLSNVSSRYGK